MRKLSLLWMFVFVTLAFSQSMLNPLSGGKATTPPARQVPTGQSSSAQAATPSLNVGDTWHYQASAPEGNSTERVLRTEACGGTQCIVDNVLSYAFNDTIWGTEGWDFFKDYCIGCDGPGVITYTNYTPLPLHPYQFPLQLGASWYVNDTESGWRLDNTGNHTFTFGGAELRKVINETTVTVPAGSIDAFLIGQYSPDGTVHAYRWFSVQAKTTVKLIRLDNTGAIAFTRVMVSYILAPVPPFNCEWDASAGLLPDQACPAWHPFLTTGPDLAYLSSGKLVLNTTAIGEKVGFAQFAPDISFPPNAVIEARLRFVSGTSTLTVRATVAIAFSTAPGIGNTFFVGLDEIFLLSNGATRGQGASVDTHLAFHTYRITVDSGGNIQVFQDDLLVLTGITYGPDTGNNGDAPRVIFGEDSSAAFGVSEWEFVRHNAHTTGCITRCVPPPAGLVSWWPGDGNANDVIGNHNGVLVNGATFGAGEVQQAFNLNGVNQFVNVTNDPAWNFGSNPFTIDLWVNFNQSPGHDTFVSHDEGQNDQNKWFFGLNPYPNDTGVLKFHINSPTIHPVSTVIAPWNPIPGLWYHVAVTRNADAYSLYINGVNVANGTNSIPVPDAAAPLTIGMAEGSFFHKGLIDEVDIFNRALTPSEIQSIFNAGSSGRCHCVTPPSGLVSWWPADGNVNDIVSGNSGSLANGVTFATGEVGQAFSFSGTNYVMNGSARNIPTAGPISFDAWIKYNSSDSMGINPEIVTIGGFPFCASGGIHGILLGGKTGVFIARGCNITPDFNCGVPNAGIGNNNWHHVATVWDGTNSFVYIDGTLRNQCPGTDYTRPTNVVSIGGRPEDPVDSPFKGLVDEVQIFNRALSPSEVQAIFNAGSAGQCRCVTPPAGLVSWWPGDGNANDIIGSNQGFISGTVDFVPSKVNQAFNFTGAGEVIIPDSPSLNIATALTIDGWVRPQFSGRPAQTADVDAVLSKLRVGVGGYDLFIAMDPQQVFAGSSTGQLLGTLFLQVNIGGTIEGVFSNSPVPNDGAFHLVAGSYDGTSLRVYIDGQNVGQKTVIGAIVNSASAAEIGAISGVGTVLPLRFTRAAVDEVDLYNRALTPSEVLSIFNAGSFGKCQVTLAPFDFSLSTPSPNSLTVVRGGTSPSASIDATLAGGSTAPVTFSASGLLSGVTASFTNDPCNPTCTVTVSFSATASATLGAATVSIDASGGGTTHTTTLSLTVIAPSIAVTVNCSSATVGKPVDCTASATGGTGGFALSWSAQGGTPPMGSGASFSTTYPNKGSETVTVTATDSSGGRGVNSATFAVAAQQLQVRISTACNSALSTVTVSKPVTCSATATGGTGPYTYKWTTLGGTPSTGTGSSFTVSYTAKGTYTLTVNVTDANDNAATQSVTNFVVTGQAITVTVTCGTATAGKPVTCNASATGGTGPYSFTWSSNGHPAAGAGASYTTVFAAKGSQTVTVTARDANSVTETGMASVNVAPQSLTPDFTFTPTSPSSGQSVTFTASSTGGSGPYTFSWNFGDSATGTGSPVQHTYTVAATATFHVVLTAKDANGVTAMVSHAVAIAAVPSFDFSLSTPSPNSVTVLQGATSSASTMGATLVSGATVPVTFSALGLPAGVTATFTNNPCSPTCAVTVSFSATPTATTGTVTVTIDVTGGSVSHTTSLSLTVTAAQAQVKCGEKEDTCSVRSNSTITNADADRNKIRLTVTGAKGTTGWANVTVPISDVPKINRLQVRVDGVKIPSSSITITMNATDYFVYFTFTFHSPVNIEVSYNPPPDTIFGLDPTVFYSTLAGLAVAVVVGIGALFARSKRARTIFPKPA